MSGYGLSREQAEKSLHKYGDNALPPPPRADFWQKLRKNFQDPVIRILLLALLLNVIFVYLGQGDWIETAGIFLALALASFVAALSEYRNEEAFQKLQEEAGKISCRVWRGGEPMLIACEDIVVGDAVILQAGDRVPADGILLEGEIRAEQAALNGESETAVKVAAPGDYVWETLKSDFLDEHRLFRGSVVAEGSGILRVMHVGTATVYGQLTQELKENGRDTPLQLKLRGLARQLSRLAYVGAVLIAAAVLLQRMQRAGGWNAYTAEVGVVAGDMLQTLILAVSIIVMAVPEGLPLMIALVSSLNMRKMLCDNVLVRRLAGIEAAGSLNLLFTDKTGTITKGQLEVVKFLTGELQEIGNFAELPPKIRELMYQQIVLNTSAAVNAEKIVGGNMTEAALGKFIGGYRMTETPERLHLEPFDSSKKFSWAAAAIHGRTYCLVKGAPEKLLARSKFYWDAQSARQKLTDELRCRLDARMQELAEQAMRLLAFCSCEGVQADAAEQALTLIGIAAIRDEVRPEAASAIAAVQNAGVQVVMLTGDRMETAAAIAAEAGLLCDPDEIICTSEELARLSDAEVKRMLPRLRVLARALPLDKLRLVGIAQELNLVVGMTGDGVNDAAALQKADVGFAMGSGTEVAKEAGDIIILDDNFLSIRQAILYGRTIYNSICRFIVFQLTINFSAVALNLAAPFIAIDKPLTITQVLWINLIMDTLAALAFGGEPALEAFLAEQPKRRTAPIVSRKMLTEIASGGICITVSAIFFYKSELVTGSFRSAPDDIYLYTGFFCAYIFMAAANAFNVRAPGAKLWENLSLNRGFVLVMALIAAVQIGMTYIGGSVLRTAPLNAQEWAAVFAFAASALLMGVLCKILTGRL